MAANFDLRGRVALVTGGAQGLGASSARALAAHGATIALLDIQAESVAAAAAQLTHDMGQTALGLACDTREKDQVEACVKTICRASTSLVSSIRTRLPLRTSSLD